MRDVPVMLNQYKLTVVEPPAPKMRDDGRGGQVPMTDQQGATVFVVSLFAKLQVQPGQRAPKGEEIRVTLETDPGSGFPEDTRVELINPRVTPFQMENNGRVTSGISFKAGGMKPLMQPQPKGDKS